MKKILLLSSFCACAMFTKAQVITDTVSCGATYANQIWYSLENDNQADAPKNNWDIAFDVSSYGTSIHINSAIGVTLWTHPDLTIADWAETADTAGITTWTAAYNSETSWVTGAFDQGVSSDPFDVGWGMYNVVTHVVSGDSIFILKLANNSYKKLWIENLSGGTFNFKYADLDGTNEQTAALLKSAYTGRNFAYYSIQNNQAVDREAVASTEWDLVFGQYTTFIPMAYTVAGVLSNKDVTVAKAENLDDAASYNNWGAHEFSENINEIGYNWKNFTGMSWEIQDSLAFFVKSTTDDIWKVIFTGFGGSGTGNFIFTKEKLSTAHVTDLGQNTGSFAIYPNPAREQLNLVYNFDQAVQNGTYKVLELSGKTVLSGALNTNSGLHTQQLETSALKAGSYIVSLEFDGQSLQHKLIIQ